MRGSRLQAIDVEELGAEQASIHPVTSTPSSPAQSATASLLALALKSLSQRALIAVASLVDLALIASAFVLWLNVMAQPTVLQLVGVGMYASFILAIVMIRSRRAGE